MFVKRVKVKNFKSFEALEVELDRLNIIIGANASGKSNFVQIFAFLRDIQDHGLENALSMQGGIEYLRNINIGSSENFSLSVVSEPGFRRAIPTEKGLIGIEIYESNYEFELEFRKRGVGFRIFKDDLTQRCNFIRLERQKKKIEEKEKLGEGKIVFSRINGKIEIDLVKPKEASIEKGHIFPPFLKDQKLSDHTLLLETIPIIFLSPWEGFFSNISIFDFDPKLPKKATPITGKAELEEDGSNLSIVLKNILGQNDKKRKLFNLVKDLLPFIDDLDVVKFADKSLLFNLRETYSEKEYLPASLISDGTINITALIVALYFEKSSLTIIEEPERNIHPYLITKVTEMMKDASQTNQIIVTTHNSEIVKHGDLKDIVFVSRDKNGFSTIARPIDREEIQTFLKNELGIEELYVQNLL